MERIKCRNGFFKGDPLFTKRLRPFGFIPDISLFKLFSYFFQAFLFMVNVKGTP
jgi:hypothetical protein